MKELIIKLFNATQKKNLTKQQLHIVEELISLGIVLHEKNKYYIDSTKYQIGTIDINRSGTGFLQLFNSKERDLIIEPKYLNGAQKGDFVVASVQKQARRLTTKVVFIAKKAKSKIVAVVQIRGGKVELLDIKDETKIATSTPQKQLKQLPPDTIVVINTEDYQVSEILGVASDDFVDEKISLALYERPDEFNLRTIIEAKSYGASVEKTLYPTRRDLTHLPFCTIDPNDAKDYDDAIYFDKQTATLYVAIADVSEYVRHYSSLDKEAYERGFTVYFPHKSIPMLPRELSENLCSLQPNVDRLAFTFAIKLDPTTFQVQSSELFESIINSKRRFTYEEIDACLDKEPKHIKANELPIMQWLIPLAKLTQQIRALRLENGYDFASDDVRLTLDDHNQLISSHTEASTLSHSLIEECMLLANVEASKLIERGIFRNHEEPSFDKINKLLGELSDLGIYPEPKKTLHKMIESIQLEADKYNIRSDVDKMIIKSQKQANYSSINQGHFGLGFKRYTHFTSPIRRYSDLILHRILKAKVIHESHKQLAQELENIEGVCASISDLERVVNKCAWDFMDRKFARWAKKHIGEVCDCVIEDTTGEMMIGRLHTDILDGVRVFVKPQTVLKFQKVQVKIVSSNTLTSKIKCEIVSI